MLNNYEDRAKSFAEATGTKITATRDAIVNKTPFDQKIFGDRWRYRVRISRDGKSFSFYFYDSIANYRKDERPTKYDILACLQKYDIIADPFEFARDFGMTIDSAEEYTRVLRTIKAVKKEYKNCRRLFGDVWDAFCDIY